MAPPSPSKQGRATPSTCLRTVLGGADSSTGDNVTPDVFDSCHSLVDEFQTIKKHYFRRVLKEHPDKGGDAATFRATRAAFEVLRDLYQSGRVKGETFASYLGAPAGRTEGRGVETKSDDGGDGYDVDDLYERYSSASAGVPSYEHYAEAAAEEFPVYRVETAKSDRSKCVKCKAGAGVAAPARAPAPAAASAATAHAAGACDDGAVEMRRSKRTAAASSKMTKYVDSTNIPKSSIRVGALDNRSGSYGRWHHLRCWRVPQKVWSGLTDPSNIDAVTEELAAMEEVLLSGTLELDESGRRAFAVHVMNSGHWASYPPKAKKAAPKKKKQTKGKVAGVTKKEDEPSEEASATVAEPSTAAGKKKRATKRKAAPTKPTKEDPKKKRAKSGEPPAAKVGAGTELTTASGAGSSAALTKVKQRFVVPRPGKDGAVANVLAGKRVVMTGLFAEVGGGVSLNLGKDRVKRMVESFGGTVTGAVSGKTDYLIVGRHPGASKVGKATVGGVTLVDLRTLQSLLLGRATAIEVAGAPPPRITNFSAGYGGGVYLM